MSQENVEVVRRWLASADKGPDGVQSAVAEFCDPDVDYYPVRKFSDGQPCHGSKEFSQFLARWLEAWSRLEWAVEDLIEVGDDRVLASARLRAEGRGSALANGGARCGARDEPWACGSLGLGSVPTTFGSGSPDPAIMGPREATRRRRKPSRPGHTATKSGGALVTPRF